MNGPALVAEYLDSRIDVIIAAWQESIRRNSDVRGADSLTRAEFRDHIPELIDRMIGRLRGRHADVSEPAEQHGHARWRQGYDLGGIVAELGSLRIVLFQAAGQCARERGFDLETLEAAHLAIVEVLNEAVVDSVRRFQIDSQGRLLAALAEAERRGRELEAEQAAVDAERLKLSTILSNLPVGVWVADARGTIIDVNHEAERLQGFSEAECVGRVNVHRFGSEHIIQHPDGKAFEHDEIPLVRALRGEVVSQQEMVWTNRNGRRIVAVNAAPLNSASGEIVGALAAIQDIDDRKRAEAELARASAQLAMIVDQSPVIIWRSDDRGRINFVNRTYQEFTGHCLDREHDQGWREGIHPGDRERCRAAWTEAAKGQTPFEESFRMLRGDGQYRWLASRGAPYRDADGTFLGHIGTCMDMTERIELEASLVQQRQLAEESSRHKGRLMSALSHDARTPLNAVFLAAQLLELHAQDLPDPEVQECLRTIRHSVRNVLDLLTDLLSLTRLDAGADPARASRFDLTSTLAECLSSIEVQARGKGVECRLQSEGLDGLTLETDRAKFKQIVANLLSNALRFTDRGSIRVFGERHADQIRISVQDTGVGIALADQARIYDEFAKLDQAGRQNSEGTGLGLAICRRLASLLNGEIVLSSEPGRGSTFTLVLPGSVVHYESAREDRATAVATATGPATSGLILIVEDHLTSRQTLARVLRRLGFETLEAGNGRDALALARDRRPLAVLMDVNMPIMDGIDATFAFRADPMLREVPIFALTGDVSLVNQRRIGEAGVDGYLEKPVSPEALQRMLAMLGARVQ